MLNGISARTDKYLEVARVLAELMVGSPARILGLNDPEQIDLFLEKVKKKKLVFSILLSYDKEEEESGVLDERLTDVYASFKEFIIENLEFLLK